jgi:hypothetical protein
MLEMEVAIETMTGIVWMKMAVLRVFAFLTVKVLLLLEVIEVVLMVTLAEMVGVGVAEMMAEKEDQMETMEGQVNTEIGEDTVHIKDFRK